mgnify:CR=1 FL=1
MFSQFKMKPDKAQPELAMVISQMMLGVFEMIPGLQWASMCPSTDESTIALLARWNSRAALVQGDLSQAKTVMQTFDTVCENCDAPFFHSQETPETPQPASNLCWGKALIC